MQLSEIWEFPQHYSTAFVFKIITILWIADNHLPIIMRYTTYSPETHTRLLFESSFITKLIILPFSVMAIIHTKYYQFILSWTFRSRTTETQCLLEPSLLQTIYICVWIRWSVVRGGKHGPQHGSTHLLAVSTLVWKILLLTIWPTFALEKYSTR